MADKTRPCLHVFLTDGGEFDFAEGLLAVEDKCPIVGDPFVWPELCKLLSEPPKTFLGLTNTKPGEPPHLRLKNFTEDGYSDHPLPLGHDDPSHEEPHLLAGLHALQRWDEWNSEDASMEERACEVYGVSKVRALNQSARDSKVAAFGKLCRKMGLEHGQSTACAPQWKRLIVLLRAAGEYCSALQTAQRGAT